MTKHPLLKIRHIARSLTKIEQLLQTVEILNQKLAGGTDAGRYMQFVPHMLPHGYGADIPGVNRRAIENRNHILRSYITGGTGIEIGALHNPAPVTDIARVLYVDYLPVAELLTRYPGFTGASLVEPDIIDDGETLHKVHYTDLDFVIASHFIEHCQNPIMTLQTMLSKLRPGGIVFLVVPDKRYTFDVRREITPFEHLLRDYEEGPQWSHRAHYEELARATCHMNNWTPEEQFEYDYNNVPDIHFHVWDADAFYQFIVATKQRLHLPIVIILHARNGVENICILQKQVP
jgi:SAM-dependent methyltransferase